MNSETGEQKSSFEMSNKDPVKTTSYYQFQVCFTVVDKSVFGILAVAVAKHSTPVVKGRVC